MLGCQLLEENNSDRVTSNAAAILSAPTYNRANGATNVETLMTSTLPEVSSEHAISESDMISIVGMHLEEHEHVSADEEMARHESTDEYDGVGCFSVHEPEESTEHDFNCKSCGKAGKSVSRLSCPNYSNYFSTASPPTGGAQPGGTSDLK